MKKYAFGIANLLLVFFLIIGNSEKVYASEGEETITITIDASDDNSGLLYAIDSDRPEAFSESNTFTIVAGTSHVIYVKDAAGNITSQTYTHKVSNPEPPKEQLNIEVGLNNVSLPSKEEEKYKNYEYLTDTPIDNSDANVISKMTTDGSDQAEKVFYTIITQEGEEFYLVIEQGSSNKVHLLNTVTVDDLTALADEGSSTTELDKQQDNLLEALKEGENNTEGTEENVTEEEKETKKSNNLYIYLLIALGGGAYYYFKIYKNKKNESMDVMDAMDMDEFVMEEDEDDEDLDFDEKEKEELLNQFLKGEDDEDELETMSPDDYCDEYVEEKEAEEDIYATSHNSEETEQAEDKDEEMEYLVEEISDEYDEELDGEEAE